MQYTSHYDSPLGSITLGSDGECLTGLWFDGQKYFTDIPEKENREMENREKETTGIELPVFQDTKRWLDSYFQGQVPDFTPKLNLICSDFRKSVCEIMLSIPYGQTMTYGEIAAEIAGRRGLKKMSAQAVGGAVGHNPISLIIPCHRVIGVHGNLTGYGGGIDRKIRLLALEGVNMDGLFRPKHSTAP